MRSIAINSLLAEVERIDPNLGSKLMRCYNDEMKGDITAKLAARKLLNRKIQIENDPNTPLSELIERLLKYY